MFTLSWNIGDEVHFICSGSYKTLWITYCALSKMYVNTEQRRDIYIWCVDTNGVYYDLKQGIHPRKAAAGCEKAFIARGQFFKSN